MKRRAALLLCAALAAFPPVARGQSSEETSGILQQLSYSFSSGAMLPAGQEGEGLDPGFHVGALIHHESGSGLSLGGELQWNRSTDPLRTGVFSVSGITRISPRDYTGAYMRLGVGAYFVGYRPESPRVAKPESLVRPGGSFGAGFEAIQWGKVGIGMAAVYHGVVLESSDALSFLTVSIDLTWRPYSF